MLVLLARTWTCPRSSTTEVLGLACTGEEEVASQHVKTVFIPAGETLLELLVIPLLMAAAQLASTSQRTARAFNIWLCA